MSTPQPGSKRSAEGPRDRDDNEENGEQMVGTTFKRASPEVMAKVPILRIKRDGAPSATAEKKPSPFTTLSSSVTVESASPSNSQPFASAPSLSKDMSNSQGPVFSFGGTSASSIPASTSLSSFGEPETDTSKKDKKAQFSFGTTTKKPFNFDSAVSAFTASREKEAHAKKEQASPFATAGDSDALANSNSAAGLPTTNSSVGDDSQQNTEAQASEVVPDDTALLSIPGCKAFILGAEKQWHERGIGPLVLRDLDGHKMVTMHSQHTKHLVLQLVVDQGFAKADAGERHLKLFAAVMDEKEKKVKPESWLIRFPTDAGKSSFCDAISPLIAKAKSKTSA